MRDDQALNDIREISIRCGIAFDGKRVNLADFELHQWPEVRKMQGQYFKALMKEVTEFEIDTLRLFGLPDIDKVRMYSLDQDVSPVSGTFEYNAGQINQYKKLVTGLGKDILGEKLFDSLKVQKGVDDNTAAYPYYEAMAFNIAAQKTLENALSEAPEWLDEEKLRSLIQLATTQNEYYKAILEEGGTRIKTRLALDYIKDVLEELRNMAASGTNPLEVGRRLHKLVGEGSSWYWNRLARSESVLAINSAFMANSRAFKVPYQTWSASSTACEICAAFDGRTWPLGFGPEPVADSHPNCGCNLETTYVTEDPIQSEWTRESPYDKPYTREERELLESLFI